MAMENKRLGAELSAVAGAALAKAPASGAFAQSAGKQDIAYSASQRCAPLDRTSSGRSVAAVVSAHRYSRENVGAVGIPISPGRDLGSRSPHELGALLVEGLRRTGVEARCFIDDVRAPRGTGVEFVINGLEWDDRGSLSISEALNVDTIKSVAAEATAARRLLASNHRYDGLNR